MLRHTTQKFLDSLNVDPAISGPLKETMLLLADAIDEAENPSASLFSEYVKVHARLMAMTKVEAVDPVEEFLSR
jgi:hypothetical protein